MEKLPNYVYVLIREFVNIKENKTFVNVDYVATTDKCINLKLCKLAEIGIKTTGVISIDIDLMSHTLNITYTNGVAKYYMERKQLNS